MTQNWFTCKVKYSKPDNDGTESKVTEMYLVNAYSYTEAEGRMYQVIQEELGVGGEVSQITKSTYMEVFRDESADHWFRCKVALVSFDEESGKEKHANQYYLTQANNVKDAYERICKEMDKSTSDYIVPGVTYTKILEVYDWDQGANEKVKLEAQGFTSVGIRPSEEFSDEE